VHFIVIDKKILDLQLKFILPDPDFGFQRFPEDKTVAVKEARKKKLNKLLLN
jgi:hypothetical protein